MDRKEVKVKQYAIFLHLGAVLHLLFLSLEGLWCYGEIERLQGYDDIILLIFNLSLQ